MKKMLSMIVGLLLTQSVLADETMDVFATYQAKGTAVLDLAKSNPEKTEEIAAGLLELVPYGYQIMDLYLVKYPECTEQFAQVKADDQKMSEMSYEDLDVGYHDGKALVEAPRTCYTGRSLVVHAYQVRALAITNVIAENMDTVDHEMNEIIERAGKIKDRLGL